MLRLRGENRPRLLDVEEVEDVQKGRDFTADKE
jgi:hypothetical protein